MNTTQNVSDEDNSKFILKKDDPIYLNYLINKFVKVQLIKSTYFTGFVHSIDPVTKSMILSVPKEHTFQTTIVPGHAILEITEMPADGIQLPSRLITVENEKDINRRKTKLISWLKHNLLPVTEYEDKITVQSVSILKPYTSLDIYAENPVIALQIRKMMDEIPDDFSG